MLIVPHKSVSLKRKKLYSFILGYAQQDGWLAKLLHEVKKKTQKATYYIIPFIYSGKGNPKKRNHMSSCWGKVDWADCKRDKGIGRRGLQKGSTFSGQLAAILWLHAFAKTHWSVWFKRMDFTECKLYLNTLSAQFSWVTQSCPTLCDPMNCSTPGLPVHQQLPELTQTHVHRISDAIQPSDPLLLLPTIPPSIKVFSNESTLRIRWPKYWSFSFSISPSNKHPGLISFRMDWLALLAVQGTLKSLLQHHSSKASILWRSSFFTVQLSHPYMTTGKTIALTRWTFVGKVISAFQYAR